MTPTDHPLQDGSFDPLALLRRSRGDDDLRDIKLRLLWLRQRVPDAKVTTELVSLDERAVVMGALVALPGGGEASGHAARRIEDEGDVAAAIEETELRAIGRALDIIGYVVTDPPATTDKPAVTPAPARTPPPAAAEAEPAREPESDEPPRREPPGYIQAVRSLREREQTGPPAPPPTPIRAEERESPVPVAPVQTPPEASTSPTPAVDDDAEPELEDVSWTAFWTWARATYQIGSRGQVEELLGAPVDRKQPAELRRLLIAHFSGEQPGES